MEHTPPLIAYILKHSSADAADLAERFGSLAAETLMLAIVETIPEEHIAELEALVKERNDDGITTFLNTHIPDIDAFVDTALADLVESTRDVFDL